MRKTDEQLISDYLDGNGKAIETLVDRHLLAVYNFALKLTSSAEASEDIAQESFIKAWKHIHDFKKNSSFQTWLFAITRNLCIDWLREKKSIPISNFDTKEGENILLSNLADDSLLPDELLMKAQDINFVQQILSLLDPLYRDVLTLRYEKSLTFEEIGEALKRPLHTVKSQHRRAIIALRRSLETRLV